MAPFLILVLLSGQLAAVDLAEPAPDNDGQAVAAALAGDAPRAEQVLELDLALALRLGFSQGRALQDALEDLDLVDRRLATVRRDYGPQASGTLSAGVEGSAADGTSTDQTLDQSLDLDLRQELPSGASVTLSTRTVRTADHRSDAYSSSLALDIRQPLLRGAGALPWRERLTAAERTYLYTRRSHELFRQELTISTVSQFWRLQQQQYALKRRDEAVERARFALEQARAFVDIGRSTANDILRAEVQVLEAEQVRTDAIAAYERSLDEFLLDLAIPAGQELRIVGELEPIRPLRIDTAQAIDLALQQRLDWVTHQDRHDDRRRSLRLAARDLLPRLDLRAGLSYAQRAEDDLWGGTFDEGPDYSASISLEIPFDRRDEVLAHQQAAIGLAQSTRDLAAFRQRVINSVSDAVRTLRQAYSTVLIQRRQSAQTALRLEKSQMDFEDGYISNRDLLEAQAEVRQAQIELFRARVDYHLAELQLRASTGTLRVDAQGQWSRDLPSYAHIDEEPR